MRIQALEDWDYIPKFAGNRELPEEERTVYRFRVLSGKAELDLRKEGNDTFPDSLESIVVKVKNPPVMAREGKDKALSVSDLSLMPELKGLYMELIVEYSSHVELDGVSGKR